MNILFIHQNFPGQFKSLAPALANMGHMVVAMTLRKIENDKWNGVNIITYTVSRGSSNDIHPWIADFETKVIRGEACFKAALELKSQGFIPDVIIAHPGWGESLFLKDVWPDARLGIYCEFYYHTQGADVGFDPEFPIKNTSDACRFRLKNLNTLAHLEIADATISPTHWQASTYQAHVRPRITVVHDGIDTNRVAPNSDVSITLNGQLTLTKNDEVITFVSRNLEPYRGYHVFMRALPEILKCRPKANVLIVGGDDVSYGAAPDKDIYGTNSWKDIFAREVHQHISEKDWNRIHFLGRIPYEQFIPVLQLSSVHVYLTYPFVLSWSLLEAMSAGCAIVASDTKPLHEAIKDGETGLLTDFFDATELASRVCNVLDNPILRESLGKNAREFAKANYDLETQCLPQQIKWVEELAGSKPIGQ